VTLGGSAPALVDSISADDLAAPSRPCPERAMVRIYTKTGDDGTTGLLYGGRVAKDSTVMQVNGAVDEAQAMLGLARAEAVPESELDTLLVHLERDLYVLMAEVATDASKRSRLTPGTTLVTEEMVTALETRIDDLIDRFEMPAEFVVPGANRVSAALDVSRTVVRRAERLVVSDPVEGSWVGRYLNRLSDLLWAMARWTEGDEHVLARGDRPVRRGGSLGASVAPTGSAGSAGSAQSVEHELPAQELSTQEDSEEG
jgi:cob(I)alamin adenosyltransferase